jgi:hypothetical protein
MRLSRIIKSAKRSLNPFYHCLARPDQLHSAGRALQIA